MSALVMPQIEAQARPAASAGGALALLEEEDAVLQVWPPLRTHAGRQ